MESEKMHHPLIVVAVGLALLAVTMPGLATHNSTGAPLSLAQADEVNDDGTLAPDIDPDSELRAPFHTNLETPRLSPEDQRGDRYTDCTKHEDVTGNYDQALRDGDACYVGFLDQQLEYILHGTSVFNLRSENGGDLYFVNPGPEDDYCRGDGDLVLRVERIVNDDPECDGDGHPWYGFGDMLIDTDLLEAPTQGNGDVDGVGDMLGKNEGSGYNFLPLIFTPYVFLFGQPHPDNPEPSDFKAGEGPFGPDPVEGGSPILDITGACGDRTQECRLLTPEDIKLYDDNDGNLGGVDDPRARVCSYRPQFALLGGGGVFSAENCGIFGDLVAEFLDTNAEGGLGVPGAPATWMTTQPGWFEAIDIITAGEVSRFGGLFHAVDKQQCATNDPSGTVPHLKRDDCDGELPVGVLTYVAVNPAVPTPDHPLWCVRPNILAHGDSIKAGTDDPGLYGPYIADAIDMDVQRPLLNSEYQMLSDAIHEDVRGVLGLVEPTVRSTVDSASAAAASTGSTLDDLVRDVDEAAGAGGALFDAYDRGQFLEDGPPLNMVNPFQIIQPEGMRCDALGLVQIEETPTTIDGNLIFHVDRSQATVSIKDPTVFSDGLPAGEGETNEGAWQADHYSFGGNIIGFLDTSANAEDEPGAQFSGCATASGQVQPNNDFCAWRPIWDAYNPDCSDAEGNPCGEVLTERGYDLDEGVGLYFVAKVSGPVVVNDEDLNRPNEVTDRSAVLGLGDPSGQNCIVGLSIGLADAQSVEVDDILADACPGHAEEDGATHVIRDAFDDGGTGSFSAAVELLKPTPTPAAGIEATGIGEDDGLCLTGVFSVQDGQISADTEGLGGLELAEGTTTYTHCVPFESSA